MGFSRQDNCSGLPFPSPGDLPDPGIEPGSPTLQADSLLSEPPGRVLKKELFQAFPSFMVASGIPWPIDEESSFSSRGSPSVYIFFLSVSKFPHFMRAVLLE